LPLAAAFVKDQLLACSMANRPSTPDIDLESCLRQVVHGIERGIGTGGDQLTGIKYHHTLTQSHRLAGETWTCVLQLREVG
jgi:hypothetical protein